MSLCYQLQHAWIETDCFTDGVIIYREGADGNEGVMIFCVIVTTLTLKQTLLFGGGGVTKVCVLYKGGGGHKIEHCISHFHQPPLPVGNDQSLSSASSLILRRVFGNGREG